MRGPGRSLINIWLVESEFKRYALQKLSGYLQAGTITLTLTVAPLSLATARCADPTSQNSTIMPTVPDSVGACFLNAYTAPSTARRSTMISSILALSKPPTPGSLAVTETWPSYADTKAEFGLDFYRCIYIRDEK